MRPHPSPAVRVDSAGHDIGHREAGNHTLGAPAAETVCTQWPGDRLARDCVRAPSARAEEEVVAYKFA